MKTQEIKKAENEKIELPKLTAKQKEICMLPESLEFIANQMNPNKLGKLCWLNKGFMLQNSGKKTLRCVYIVDVESAFQALSMVQHTISLLDGVLELYPYTVKVDIELYQNHVLKQTENHHSESNIEVA
jgi:hypothetical protein